MDRSELLVKHGFIKGNAKGKYKFNDKIKEWEALGGDKISSKDADEENREVAFSQYDNTGYPKPIKSYELEIEVFDLSLEGPYFWFVDTLKQYVQHVDKLEDSFSASENSAFFGVTQQRLGAQQDKISQFLAATGKMIKELFQMVRELRILDERLNYYEEIETQLAKPMNERSKSASMTMKGMFIDLVQGGGKSAASVYGMARELEFITLPDLFFDTPPLKNTEELDRHVNNLAANFNQNVLRVLTRHLRQYIEWRKRTYQEHKTRKGFMLSYLRQHFDIIQMYITWIKPYLRYVNKLTLKDKGNTVDLISAFEGSLLDIEFLARNRVPIGDSGANGCVLYTMNYRTRPELKVVQEGYQRGPVHIGKLILNARVYGWSDEQVASYKKLKEAEALLLMGDISNSVKEAMESLGKDLEVYLAEARGLKKEEENSPEGKKKKSLMEKMFGDFYTSGKSKSKGKSVRAMRAQQEKLSTMLDKGSPFMKSTRTMGYESVKNFKKSRNMFHW